MLDELSETPYRTLRDKILFLRSLPNFVGIDDEGLHLLAENARIRVFQEGETVMEEGAPTPAAHVVMDGELSTRRFGKTTAVVDRGGGAGFPTLLAQDEHGITAIANEYTVTLEIPRDVLFDAYAEAFSLVRNNLRVIGRIIVQRRGSLPTDAAQDDVPGMGEYRDQDRTLVEKMLQMRVGPFASCNLDAIVDLARATEEIRLDAGETLWDISEPSETWLRLDYGRIKCTNDEGVSVRVGPPFVLGIMDALGDVPRSYSAVTETPIIAFVMSREAMLAVMETHYDLCVDFMRILSSNFLRMLDRDAK